MHPAPTPTHSPAPATEPRHRLATSGRSRPDLHLVEADTQRCELTRLLTAWLAEYPNPATRKAYGLLVASVAAHARATSPADLTPAALGQWAASVQLANNTMRAKITAVRAFLAWCLATGQIDSYRDEPMKRLLRSYPPTYGKVQSKHPANRLDHDGYHRLLAACQDGTDAGLQDELTIRLAVSGGMRVSELRTLTIADLRHAPHLTWTGKARKQRTAICGTELLALIQRYLARYSAALSRPLQDTDPVISAGHAGPGHDGSADHLNWGQANTSSVPIRRRIAHRAHIAGLGHLTPHDLKRTAARMMHEARSADGGHLFDLLEIADVLDHSNPKVTKDCYIGPLGSDNKRRAADLFD